MRNYELVFIANPELEEDDLAAVVEKVKNLVERNGGKITQAKSWGLRRLAYPIKDEREGQYVLVHLELEPQEIAELERNLGLNEQILRHLVVRREE